MKIKVEWNHIGSQVAELKYSEKIQYLHRENLRNKTSESKSSPPTLVLPLMLER